MPEEKDKLNEAGKVAAGGETGATNALSEGEQLKSKLATLEAERLAAKEKEVAQLIEKMDDKIKELKQFVANTEVAGQSMAAPPEPTTEEKQKKEINDALDGTGLSI